MNYQWLIDSIVSETNNSVPFCSWKENHFCITQNEFIYVFVFAILVPLHSVEGWPLGGSPSAATTKRRQPKQCVPAGPSAVPRRSVFWSILEQQRRPADFFCQFPNTSDKQQSQTERHIQQREAKVNVVLLQSTPEDFQRVNCRTNPPTMRLSNTAFGSRFRASLTAGTPDEEKRMHLWNDYHFISINIRNKLVFTMQSVENKRKELTWN